MNNETLRVTSKAFIMCFSVKKPHAMRVVNGTVIPFKIKLIKACELYFYEHEYISKPTQLVQKLYLKY